MSAFYSNNYKYKLSNQDKGTRLNRLIELSNKIFDQEKKKNPKQDLKALSVLSLTKARATIDKEFLKKKK